MTYAENRVLAVIGDRRVMYSDVWCHREAVAKSTRGLRGKTVEEVCLDHERERFREAAARLIVEKACEVDPCALTAADIEKFRSPLLKEESAFQQMAEPGRKRAEAARRVLLGEPVEAVYDDTIKPMNPSISLDKFRREIEMFRSVDAIDRFLAKDWAAKLRQDAENRAVDGARRAAIRRRIEANAAARNQSLDAAADEYLRFVVATIGVTIVDEQFQLPAGREAFL